MNLPRRGTPRGCPIGGQIGPGAGRHEASPSGAVERLAPGSWKGLTPFPLTPFPLFRINQNDLDEESRQETHTVRWSEEPTSCE